MNNGMPGGYGGQWGNPQPQQPQQHQQMNAYQMQQQMHMMQQQQQQAQHQQQQHGQSQMIGVGGSTTGQLAQQQGLGNNNPAAMMMGQFGQMGHHAVGGMMGQASQQGGGAGGMANAAFVQQQLQQQQAAQAQQQQQAQNNPQGQQLGQVMGGQQQQQPQGGFNQQAQQQTQQAQAALYWNALQASGGQGQGQQAQAQAQAQAPPQAQPQQQQQQPQQHGMAGGMGLTQQQQHHQQQQPQNQQNPQGVMAQLQQAQNQQQGSSKQQGNQPPQPAGTPAPGLDQGNQTQLLLQQQNLIAQLQQQLQQQQQTQPPSNQSLPGQGGGGGGQMGQPLPGGLGGQQQQQMPGQSQPPQPNQFGNSNNIPSPTMRAAIPSSPSIGGQQSQQPRTQTQNQHNQFPPAMQQGQQQRQNNSFGLQQLGGRQSSLERQQQQQAQLQQLQQQQQLGNTNASAMAQLQQGGQNQAKNQSTANQQANIQNMFGNTSAASHLQQRQAAQQSHTPNLGGAGRASSTPGPPQGSPAIKGVSAGPSSKSNKNPSQQAIDAMRRATSSVHSAHSQTNAAQPHRPPSGTPTIPVGGQTTAAQQQAQKDQQQKQHQLLMAHMLQQQMGGRAGDSGASSTPAPAAAPGGTAPGAPAAGGEPGVVPGGDNSSPQGVMLEQRVKQFQVMQHLQQLQQQKVVGDGSGPGGDNSNNKNNSATNNQKAGGAPNQAANRRGSSSGNKNASGGGTSSGGPSANKDKAPGKGLRRGSQGSTLSQGSLDQVSLSQGSLGIVDPDPIADGVNVHDPMGPTPIGSAATGCAPQTGEEGGVKGGQHQSFLDGHFAGGWQSNADLPDRRRINFHIIKVIERMRPDANRMSQNRLPLMAKKLEEHLYRSAHTKDEYIDPASLKRRLHLIAKGVGIPKPDDEDLEGGGGSTGSQGGGDLNNSSHSRNNSSAVPIEAPSQAPGPAPPASTSSNANQAQQQANSTNNVSQDRAQQMMLQQRQNLQSQQVNNNAQQQSIDSSAIPGLTSQDLTNGGDGSNPRTEKKKVILLQQQRRLLLLRHASKCDGGASCRTKFCPQMVTLWKHMKKCRDKHCKVSHCLSSRCVLNHYRVCKSEGKTASCSICAPVMKHIRNNGDANGVGLAGGLDGGVDELDALVLDSNGLDPLDPADIDGNGLADAGSLGGNNTNDSTSSLSPNPSIPTAIGGPQDPQQQTNNNSDSLSAAMGAIQQNQPFQQQNQTNVNTGSLQEMQHELQKKQLLLQQVQQQKANLFGQSQKLQQQLMAAMNTQQSQQLQKQQTILQQLNQQFEQQQTILQSEIQRQTFVLQQQAENNNAKPSSAAPTPSTAANSNVKRSSEAALVNGHQGSADSRPNKKAKTGESTDSSKSDKPASCGIPEKTSPDAAPADKAKASSLIPTMPTAQVEQHIESLTETNQMTPRYIARKCLPLVRKLIDHDHGWVFKDAVDPVELGIPEYFQVVEHPMDLTLVVNKLGDGAYKDISSFERDTKLVFENAILFNGDDSDVGGMAKELLDIFAIDLKNAMKGMKISYVDKEPQKRRGNSCGLCGNYRRLFDPPALFCSGSCGMQKIRRNATYYTDRFKQNHWCERCFNNLKEGDKLKLDDGKETKKVLLMRLKNDATPEESWVQCDRCNEWNHQICALVDRSKGSLHTCPKCLMKDRASGKEEAPVGDALKCASDLPHCNLSRAVEGGLSKSLLKAYEKVAADRGCAVAQVEKADGLSVRVVSSLQKKHLVRDEMLARYANKGYPEEFKVTTKCIVLFQKIHGVDVLLFGMYVYEYGDDCAGPNRRRVYISYLDSVRYLEPSSYRTVVYQSVITEYLKFVKMRGFHTAHIWSCPPAKGDEYIFHCHPNHQLTPNDDLLCAWYVETLEKAKEEGIVVETRTLYDEYFKNDVLNPKTGDNFDPTSLPYFEGDYIPGEIEKIIKEVNEDDSKREDTKQKGLKGCTTQKKQEGRRAGTRSNPGELVNQSRDKVMNRLDLVLVRMKKNFMVAQLLSDDFIKAVENGEDVSSWKESGSKKSKKGKNPNLLELEDSRPKDSADSLVWEITGDTKDHDPVMEQDCIDTRLQFLNYCQRNNYQFDELRRAKYTTMMLLVFLHNPRAEHDQQIRAHLDIILHAGSCSGPPGCASQNCQRMKQLFQHIGACDVTYKRGCKICMRLFALLTRHSKDCSEAKCPIPYCGRIKERTRMLLRQQRMMDDRRRDAQNERLREEATQEG